MKLRWNAKWVILASCLTITMALPDSLIEKINASEMKETNKVKRSQADEHVRDSTQHFYNKPTAIKRGNNLKNLNPDQQFLNDWEQERSLYQNQDNLANIQSSLYNTGENLFDDKTIAEYEKGFHYGTNKEKLDEALQNAILKSELYGEPASINQYRYYGMDDRRRKRRDTKKIRVDNRLKREVDLTPEEILTILTLYENERSNNPGYNQGYRANWPNYEGDVTDLDDSDENWMDSPVYPHATTRLNDLGPNYLMEEKRGRWGGFGDARNKRFMVAKKRNDPTRELRYLNGPSKNDFYTLSQLLSNQRDPNVPLYHRLVL